MATSHTLTPNASVAADSSTSDRASVRVGELATYVAVGAALGIVMVKTEVVSWYRIQEMFRFQSFHMFGVLGSAMLTALVSLEILTRTHAHALSGDPIVVAPKQLGSGRRYWIGGIIFGVGWNRCLPRPAVRPYR